MKISLHTAELALGTEYSIKENTPTNSGRLDSLNNLNKHRPKSGNIISRIMNIKACSSDPNRFDLLSELLKTLVELLSDLFVVAEKSFAPTINELTGTTVSPNPKLVRNQARRNSYTYQVDVLRTK